MLFKVVVQKPIVGKSKPTENDLRRARRVYLVEAESDVHAAQVLEKNLEQYPVFCGVVSIGKVMSRVVILHP